MAVESLATYTCHPDYVLSYPATRVCMSTGLWSGTAPTCNPIGNIYSTDLTRFLYTFYLSKSQVRFPHRGFSDFSSFKLFRRSLTLPFITLLMPRKHKTGCVMRKGVFEHARNAQIQIQPPCAKSHPGLLLSTDTLNRVKCFYYRIAKTLIRLEDAWNIIM